MFFSENESVQSKNYDGADANSEASAELPAPGFIDLTDDDWKTHTFQSLPAVQKRNSTAPAVESINVVLPPFTGRNSGSGVNTSPGVPLGKTALQYLMLFFTSAILHVFIVATNSFGRYNNANWRSESSDEGSQI